MKPEITMKRTHQLFTHLFNSYVLLKNSKLYDILLNSVIALEKQVPMKVTNEKYCPNCDEAFFDSWQPNYCPVCGQRLDWGDKE